jgi:hypothetical protein
MRATNLPGNPRRHGRLHPFSHLVCHLCVAPPRHNRLIFLPNLLAPLGARGYIPGRRQRTSDSAYHTAIRKMIKNQRGDRR